MQWLQPARPEEVHRVPVTRGVCVGEAIRRRGPARRAAATEKAKEAELTDGQLVTKALASAAAGLPCEFTSERVVLWFDAKGKVACRGGVPPLATGATLE